MKLAFCREPYPDELLYGYVCNVFEKNGRKSLEILPNSFNAHVRIVNSRGLTGLCENIENVTFPDIPTAVNMTPLGYLIDGLPEGKASKTAEAFVQPEETGSAHFDIKEPDYVCICPDCWEEDLQKYGEGYLHLSHNLPGVRTCTKHGKALVKIDKPSGRSYLRRLTLSHKEEIQTDDLESERTWTEEINRKNSKGLKLLKQSTCPSCGCTWVETEYSRKTEAGCPVCNAEFSEKEILQRRLNARFPDEYEVREENDSLKVFHKPCGTERKDVNALVYGDPKVCEGCLQLTPESLQKRYDPDGEKWKFLPIPEEERRRKRLTVKCQTCGHIFHPFSPIWSQEQKCPSCESKQERKEISETDPEYKVVGHYKDNRTPVKIRHLDCGTTFETSKNSFMRGCRCPLCTPRYSFADVEDAVHEYLPGWKVSQGEKRGTAVLTGNEETPLILNYQEIMIELKKDVSSVFPDKEGIYKEDPNTRRKIYDEIKLATKEKGFWTFSDGLFGKPVDRVTRNLVQNLCKAGYLERTGKGKYRINEQQA